MRISSVARYLLRAIAGIGIAVACYAGAAVVLGRIPVNSDFTPAANGIEIFLLTNGMHAALALPRDSHGLDLSRVLPIGSPRSPSQADYVLVGWGDRRIYPSTATLRELTLTKALTALLGLNGAVMNIEAITRPPLAEMSRSTRIAPEAYRRLVDHIAASLKRNAAGTPIALDATEHPSSPDARFFLANGRYQLFLTCNEWVRRALATAGVRTPSWSPLDGPLFLHFPG